MTEGADVAENTGTESETDTDGKTDPYSLEVGGYQGKYGAHSRSAQSLTYQTSRALHPSGTTGAMHRGSHHHDDIVGGLEHAEPYATHCHAPRYIPFGR